MLSSPDGYRLVPEHRTGFSSNPAVWSYGMAMPWQHPAQQLAFPIPLHFVTPQLNAQWFPVENFGSLPPKPKVNKDITSVFGNTKPSRRFSDPGPRIRDTDNDGKHFHSHKSKVYVPFEEKWNHSENQRIDEASKDRMLSNLLQELKTARDFNRQLCLELHKANMKLHLTQQHTNEHQPGSMAALVRKLYDAHHIRSDVLSNWSKSAESCGRKSSCTSNKFDSDDPEDSLLREREVLITRLQTTEKKIQRLRNAQWNNVAPEGPYGPQSTEQRSPMNTSRCMGDLLTFNKVSRNHSFAMTSPSTSDPPSLEDLDIASSKHYGGTGLINSGLAHLHHPTSSRQLPEGRTYLPNSNVVIPNATSMVGPTLKRDIELQLATVERDRRQLEHQLQDSIGTRRLSEDRVIKLERLVSVLRKKLEMQTTIHNTSSSNCSAALPSPNENNRPSATSCSTTPNEYVTYSNSGRASQLSMEGPASLPSYLQVVGPITQL
ncbi:hypothetical protein OUZ56_005922 [Daphnia magna]|uniref:Uncharacterized protein n=1 Tax=Daphnia magna TaxID=35525 RepID=A0ABQ9YU48_9CRUS|nr:hypothetical protein OUZ56_005922 [Daphnia magna]